MGCCERDCDGDLTFVLFYDLVMLVIRVVDSAREPVTCPSAFSNAILSQEFRVLSNNKPITDSTGNELVLVGFGNVA